MTDDDFYGEREHQDARRVDLAVIALQEGRLAFAERELLAVAERTPARYEYLRDVIDSESGSLLARCEGGYDCAHDWGRRRCIKAWDRDEFAHYIRWHEAEQVPHSLAWLKAAYPPAYYYLAVISLERGNAQEALNYLSRGLDLEMNAKFVLEGAAAHINMGKPEEALKLYAAFPRVALRVQPKHVAIAARGTASILVELGKLDNAEAVLKDLLEAQPEDEVAWAELQYIAELRAGRPAREPRFRLTTPDGHEPRRATDKH